MFKLFCYDSLEQLREWGVDISAGQIEQILNEGKERFHQEKAMILRVGLEVSESLTGDDTGARHQGQGGAPSYRINAPALQYRQEKKLPKGPWEQLKHSTTRVFEGTEQWQAHLLALHFTTKRHIRIATEGALWGALRQRGILETLAFIRDDAGQFDVLTHGLCGVHAERLIHPLIPLNEQHREDQRSKLSRARPRASLRPR